MIKSSYKQILNFAIIFISFFVVGCQLDVPIKEMVKAKKHITRANEVKAYKYDPDNLEKANNHLYNCHKLFGQGGKKRGPELDNIGNLMTSEALREKILDPKSWMAEGFDKQYKKGKMPDKYKDLMFDEEIDALVAFLVSLKDASVNTPKPIKMK